VDIFGQKYKNPQKLNKARRIEDFVNGKPYHTPREYPGYDVKISLQHGVSHPLKPLHIVFRAFFLSFL
jgi:hypothetical protein